MDTTGSQSSILNPFNNSGISSASGLMGYSYMHEAVIGVQPPTEGTEPCTQDVFFQLGIGTPITVKNEVQVQLSFYEDRARNYQSIHSVEG